MINESCFKLLQDSAASDENGANFRINIFIRYAY